MKKPLLAFIALAIAIGISAMVYTKKKEAYPTMCYTPIGVLQGLGTRYGDTMSVKTATQTISLPVSTCLQVTESTNE